MFFQSDIQTEFRFSRVHIWYKYFIDKEPLFPPLNIIPTPGKIVSALKYIFRKVKCKNNNNNNNV